MQLHIEHAAVASIWVWHAHTFLGTLDMCRVAHRLQSCVQVYRALGILVHHSPSCLNGPALASLSEFMWGVFDNQSISDVRIVAAELLAVGLLVFEDAHTQELHKHRHIRRVKQSRRLDGFWDQRILESLREALPSRMDKERVSRAVTASDNVLGKQLTGNSTQAICEHIRYSFYQCHGVWNTMCSVEFHVRASFSSGVLVVRSSSTWVV
jgi:hypothetical protein